MAIRVVRAVVRFSETGQGDVKRLRPPMYGYRIRVSDWRVLLDLDQAGAITVRPVEHRSRVCKNR